MTWPDNCVYERNFYLFPFSVEIRPFTPFAETINLHETPILPTIYDTSATIHVTICIKAHTNPKTWNISNLSNRIDLKSMIRLERQNRDKTGWTVIYKELLIIYLLIPKFHTWWNSSKFNDIFDTHTTKKNYSRIPLNIWYIYPR